MSKKTDNKNWNRSASWKTKNTKTDLEIGHPNIFLPIKEIKLLGKTLSIKKMPGLDGYADKFCQIFFQMTIPPQIL